MSSEVMDIMRISCYGENFEDDKLRCENLKKRKKIDLSSGV